ncbi:MAG: hypothetical protein QG597_2108 [Actinomycetota bacterium]|nr:hypothetical protein [Actinomycetota bacterium]
MVAGEGVVVVTGSVGPCAGGPGVDSAAARQLGGRAVWTKPLLVALNDVASGQLGAGYLSDGPNPDLGS